MNRQAFISRYPGATSRSTIACESLAAKRARRRRLFAAIAAFHRAQVFFQERDETLVHTFLHISRPIAARNSPQCVVFNATSSRAALSQSAWPSMFSDRLPPSSREGLAMSALP
ncbi:hypothetical protein [Burkholderia sp. SRS-W-2-2016]|uniref:hypothetical protein n=1 Tax=Burkholderia sp. SRS-W-2-2016 TaxID=1926878 RepID=UPI0009FA34DD|nr:hypothetical protein [Burkholderia sp. SRS-W-2-2016]